MGGKLEFQSAVTPPGAAKNIVMKQYYEPEFLKGVFE
jgi:hypothetical protein